MQVIDLINNGIKKLKHKYAYKVSIIIINWNAGSFLKETIESIYKQVIDVNFEIIVIDNNSNKFALFHLDKEKINKVAGLSGCCLMINKYLNLKLLKG